MAHVMPEIVLRRIIQIGINELRVAEQEVFDDIFFTFAREEMNAIFGQEQINKVREWFSITKIPVVSAWGFNPDRIPMFSIHLASETEDESKASVNDFFGGAGFDLAGEEVDEIKVATFNVMLDIGIHANRSADEVLWMYYACNYILFKKKATLERLGLQLQTFSASDYSKDAKYMGDNIWTRWIRFRCTVQNTWRGDRAPDIVEIDLDIETGSATDLE